MDYPLSRAAAVQLHNGTTDGDPSTGIPQSLLDALTDNDVIDLILGVQTAGGIAKVQGDTTQLATAIAALIATAQGNLSEFKPILDANYEIVAADWGGYVALSAPTANRTFTVDNGVGPAVIRVTNLANGPQTLTLQIKGGSTALFFGQPVSLLGGVSSFALSGGDEVEMIWNGTNWHIIRSSNPLAVLTALTFGSANGVLKLPNFQNLNAPIIVQWNSGTLPNSGAGQASQAITWNQSFPSQVSFATANARGTTGTGLWVPSMGKSAAVTLSGTTFKGDLLGAGVFNSTVIYDWLSIGD